MEKTFGARLKSARKLAELTQLELAAKLGVTPTTVSKWERDKSSPLPRYLRQLKKRLSALAEAA